MNILGPQVQSALLRLKGITGFVTTLTREHDPRAEAFRRYDHIERVRIVNRLICDRWRVDPSYSDAIVVLHDLNRLPFAHNIERGWYAQGEDVRRFLGQLDSGIPESCVDDVVCLHRKDLAGMSSEGLSALLADMIAGVFEDPLLTVSGLNVSADIVPADIGRALGLDFGDEVLVRRLVELSRVLHAELDPEAFRRGFGRVFEEGVERFVDARLSVGRAVDAECEEVRSIVRSVKDGFLVPIVFPINNEGVCHASWLRRTLRPAWIAHAGHEAAVRELLTLTEPELMARLRASPDFADLDVGPAFPNLEYARDAPTLATLW